ncbi:hypothetical protein [Pseudomonas syringae]|uniref:hypothetical protein n=1 Tax=Pseudomonas syringae TaxID=317 RepID=UPI0013CEB7C1|nr:hypothetical protein [Pseudomonas syringae]MCF5724171.1 hypothetical protein [Pseudomonas syringae]
MMLRDVPLITEERVMNCQFSPYTSFVSSLHRFNNSPAKNSTSRQPTAAKSPTLAFNAEQPVKKTPYRSGMDNLNRNSPL